MSTNLWILAALALVGLGYVLFRLLRRPKGLRVMRGSTLDQHGLQWRMDRLPDEGDAEFRQRLNDKLSGRS